ncbi:MAG: DUF58 domain-containing protein [Polyangiaceae bacterium]|nr:DUF58 domain-containing protein [Polyangiaceae bacterium]MCW5792255.1 DUF58 domain-containing protein [Polyangiaceae bacterium]
MPALSHASSLDWGELSPLRLTARTVADGVYAGLHPSPRRGAGIEFGGHREYVPGDDLRWLDHRTLMRHGRLMIKEFETETDRALRLIVDASASMGFRSDRARGAKLAYAALIAAALTRIAIAAGDPVALEWLGGQGGRSLPAIGGREAFERIVGTLELAEPDPPGQLTEEELERALTSTLRQTRRGAIIVLFSDLLDLPESALERFAALGGAHRRTLVVVQVLDPLETDFALSGPLRLRATESRALIETDAETAREGYLAALGALQERWRARLISRRGRLVVCDSASDPVEVVRSVIRAAEGRLA